MASGLLLALAFPPWNLWPLAWVAMAPFAIATLKLQAPNPKHQTDNPGKTKFGVWRLKLLWGLVIGIWRLPSFRLGFLAGLVFWLSTLYWLLWLGVTAEGIPRWLAWVFALFAWTGVSAVCSLYFGLWTLGLWTLSKRFDTTTARGSLAITVLGACLWIALEWVRAHLWVGFPWNQLGVSQYRTLTVMQFADTTGVYGVSFQICLANLALACWRRTSLVVSFGLVLALQVAGLVMTDYLGKPPLRRGFDVAVIQGSIAQNDKWRAANEREILERYEKLTRIAASASRHQLVIWPETSTPRPLNFDKATLDAVTAIAQAGNTYLLVGTIDAVGRDSTKNEDVSIGNAAFLIKPDGTFADKPYWKIRLVPFGEYIPLSGIVQSLKNLAGFPSLTAGKDYRIFSMNLHSAIGGDELLGHPQNSDARGSGPLPSSKFSVLICFEDVFADHARIFVKNGAQFLINITNDAWWGRSAGAEQHLANAVFRAVENRVWLVRCANTGLSCFINPNGEVVQTVTPFTEGVTTASLPQPRGRQLTFYTKYGDVFAFACMAAVLAWLATEGFFYARKRRAHFTERR